MHSIRGNTYVYESTYRYIFYDEEVKSKYRNQMTDWMDDNLRFATTNTGIDKRTIVSEKP